MIAFFLENISKKYCRKKQIPPIVKIEVKNELKNIENFIAKIFKAPLYTFMGRNFR